MKRRVLAIVSGMSLAVHTAAVADKVRDWKDLDGVHHKVLESITDMARAAAANHYDMEGHARKAEALLREAEKELNYAVESAKAH